MRYNYHSISDKGQRARNEDYAYPTQLGIQTDLFIVCDGLGGHGNGDLASRFAIEKLVEVLQYDQEVNADYLHTAFRTVNTALQSYGKTNGNPEMGSTAVILKLNGKSGVVGWVGDSRLYHFRNGELLFKTEDHTIRELYRQRGFFTGHDFLPNKNIIWQALGTSREEIQPSIEQLSDIQRGDYFLLASDGLAEACTEEYLLQLSSSSANELVDTLHECCQESAKDNFTFTLVEVG